MNCYYYERLNSHAIFEAAAGLYGAIANWALGPNICMALPKGQEAGRNCK
jgi:hypothetical protein